MPDAPVPNTADTAKSTKAPLPSVEGVTTVDAGMLFEVECAAYESVGAAARAIRERVSKTLGSGKATLIFLHRPPGELVGAYRAFLDQVGNLKQSFTSAEALAAEALKEFDVQASLRRPRILAENAPGGGPADLSGALAGAFSLLGLLRADVAFSGRKAEVHPLALALELARQWEERAEVTFTDLRFFPPLGDDGEVTWRETILMPIDETVAARQDAFRAIHLLAKQYSALKEGDPKAIPARMALDSARHHFEQSDQLLRALQHRLNSADERDGLSLLQALRIGAMIQGGRLPESSWFLYAQVFSAGGSFRTVRHLLRLLFFGDGAQYSGGVIVGFALCDRGGVLRRSGTLSRRTPFRALYDWLDAWIRALRFGQRGSDTI